MIEMLVGVSVLLLIIVRMVLLFSIICLIEGFDVLVVIVNCVGFNVLFLL